MPKSLNGNHKGASVGKRRINKKRLAAVLAGITLAGGISITAIKEAFNKFNDTKEAIVYVDQIDRQINEEEKNQLREVIGEENYSKIDDFLKYSNVILRGDGNEEEAKRYIDENLDSFHDIYLETLKMKIAEMVGMTNPNQIRNITIHRNVVKDGEAPRYQYDIEKVYNQAIDAEAKERLDEVMTLNLFTGDYSFTTTNEDITDHIDNVIEISSLEGKENKSESDYKIIAKMGNSYGRMLNDKIKVADRKGFFEKSDDFEYEDNEENQYNISPDKEENFGTEVANTDNDDIDM